LSANWLSANWFVREKSSNLKHNRPTAPTTHAWKPSYPGQKKMQH